MPAFLSKHNVAGFSIIEVMIAAAIALIVAYGVNQSIIISQKGQKQNELNDRISDLRTQIQIILSNDRTCEMNFYDKPFDAKTALPVKLILPNELSRPGEILAEVGMQKSGLKFNRVELKPVGAITDTKFLGKIFLEIERMGGLGPSIKILEQPITVIVDKNSKKIQSCYGEVSKGNGCLTVGGQMANGVCQFSEDSCRKISLVVNSAGTGCEVSSKDKDKIKNICEKMGLPLNSDGTDCEADPEALSKMLDIMNEQMKNLENLQKNQ